ncbi:MAG: DNA-formamidopyrimidine glycosylase family protein [Pseudomonadota bacterium]
MPEGDTIHKIANYLKPRLDGQPLESLVLADRCAERSVSAKSIKSVRAAGKHLFVDLDNGQSVRSHLGMHGSWHRYPLGEPWRKPRSRASVVITVNDNHYVCFNAKEVELIRTPSVRSSVVDHRLGPDLTAGAVDLDLIVRRVRELCEPDTLLADVLLDQRVASGIGNVYKSEVLFIHRVPPTCELGCCDDAELKALYATASKLLGSNLGGGRRVTRREGDNAGRLWVYRREGLPCLRCDHPVAYTRLGRHHRSTYWCPACQNCFQPDRRTTPENP